jgi:hypothetical protein
VTVVNPSHILGAAESFSVLSGTAVVSTGVSSVSGDLGVSPGGSITGFPPGNVGGDIHAGDALAGQAGTAVRDVYDELSDLARTTGTDVTGNMGGRTFTAGVYRSVPALALTGTVILDAEGDPEAVFIFHTDAAFNTAAASVVTLANGAIGSNVYWVVAGAAGTGANSFLSGTIVANGAITLGASTQLIGRALSLDAVTMDAATIRFTNALPPTLSIGSAAVTKDTTPTISGTTSAPASSPITVTVAGQALQTAAGAQGAWSVTTAALSAGVHTIVAKVRDPAGNGSSATQALTVEINPSPLELGASATFSALAGTSVVSTGATTLSGAIGVSPGTTLTGFPPGVYAGARHVGDVAAATAQSDLLAAIEDALTREPHTRIAGNLGGQTFHVGVHRTATATALALTGTVTLDAEGNPDAVFIFVTDAAFDTAAASRVALTNGAQASNVFWVADGAMGAGANSFLSGSVLARGSVTLGAETALTGQVLSRAAVTMAGAVVTGISQGAPIVSQGKPASASSEENAFYEPASAAVDGNLTTRWSGAFSDPQWVMIDLGQRLSIERVDLYWEATYGTAYEVQVSDTGTGDWRTLYSTTTGPGGDESLTVEGEGRFVRMLGATCTTGCGYSLWEFQVFGAPIDAANPGESP